MSDSHVAFKDLNDAWSIGADGRHLFSDGFDHDVKLTIDGDWESPEQRIAYAAALAHKLNDHTLAGFERSSAAEAATVLLRALGWGSGGLGAAAIEIVKERDELRKRLSDCLPAEPTEAMVIEGFECGAFDVLDSLYRTGLGGGNGPTCKQAAEAVRGIYRAMASAYEAPK